MFVNIFYKKVAEVRAIAKKKKKKNAAKKENGEVTPLACQHPIIMEWGPHRTPVTLMPLVTSLFRAFPVYGMETLSQSRARDHSGFQQMTRSFPARTASDQKCWTRTILDRRPVCSRRSSSPEVPQRAHGGIPRLKRRQQLRHRRTKRHWRAYKAAATGQCQEAIT